uniref:cbb3-type cytochrome c oxidase subunit 3 n=1 Tax=Parerythrobacter lutipelagi TaxID=1964208 RepID=UPI0010F86728|nr:cbb3-type cytochrome c oxidase subunit 3 [Parerythrobacter lutipelagi]
MSVYETLRHFADSWFLLVMFLLFLTFCLWPFRPGAKDHNQAAANSIFEGQDDGE